MRRWVRQKAALPAPPPEPWQYRASAAVENIYDRRVDITLLRKKVGMVFQQPTPFPMSVYDNIAYGPRLQGLRDRHILDRKA